MKMQIPTSQRPGWLALAVSCVLLTACGGGGDDEHQAAPSPSPTTVADINRDARTVPETGTALATPADAEAPDDTANEPVVIASDTMAAPEATPNDADAPSDTL